MSEIKIKSCPSCNSDNISNNEIGWSGGEAIGFALVCDTCLMQGPTTITPKAALVFWNRLPRESDKK